MESASEGVEGTTFTLDVGSHGGMKLKEAVKEKLSEFMGSYTDDVLAEYVVVLVGHGKRQAQAIIDLEAFLGEQSKAFVVWLWDHLILNKSSYLFEAPPPLLEVSEAHDKKNDPFQEVREVQESKNKSSEGGNMHIQAENQQNILKSQESSQALATAQNLLAEELPTRVAREVNEKGPTSGRKQPEQRPASSGRTKAKGRDVQHRPDDLINSDGCRYADDSRALDTKRARSPEAWSRRGRGRLEEKLDHQGDSLPPRVKASRRLLVSAVRDAVAPTGVSMNGGNLSRKLETGSKRLRSVVAANVENVESTDGNGRQPLAKPRLEVTKHVSKFSPAMAVALRAAAAAAEDVNNNAVKGRGRQVGSVWDRLGNRAIERLRAKDAQDDEAVIASTNAREEIEDRIVEGKPFGSEKGQDEKINWRKIDDRIRKTDRESGGVGIAVQDDIGLGETGYLKEKKLHKAHWQGSIDSNVEILQYTTAIEDEFPDASNHKDEIPVRYGVSGDRQRLSPEKGDDLHLVQTRHAPITGLLHSSEKISTGHVNVGSIPVDYTSLSVKNGSATEKLTGSSPPASVDSNDVLEMRKRMRQVQLEMTKLRAKQVEVSKEVQKVVNSPIAGMKPKAQLTQEDIDQQSICVHNVHFAATKEAIAAHFNQCGEVVRVTILMDATTGKPKGSAYVEFSAKDSVEKAMNLNDSSLLSRMLKVVRKDSPELASPPVAVRPPHVPTLSSVRMNSGGKFLRGPSHLMWRSSTGVARPFGGTPHLQWKRETGLNGVSNYSHTNGSLASPGSRKPSLRNLSALSMGDRYGFGPIRPSRSLSYVRPAPYIPRGIPGNVQEQKVAN